MSLFFLRLRGVSCCYINEPVVATCSYYGSHAAVVVVAVVVAVVVVVVVAAVAVASCIVGNSRQFAVKFPFTRSRRVPRAGF